MTPAPLDFSDGHLDLPFDDLCTIDFESFYSRKEGMSLSAMPNEEYVRDPRFEVIGVGVRYQGDALWMEAVDFAAFAAGVDWGRTALLAHNAPFDALIAAHHFGVVPAFYIDTLAMARAMLPAHLPKGIKELGPYFGLGEKGHEVENFEGYRRADFTPEQWAQYGRYCLNDGMIAEGIFEALAPEFPLAELWHIDTTVRMFTVPSLEADLPALRAYAESEKARKAALLRETIPHVEPHLLPLLRKATTDEDVLKATKKVLGSGDKFAAVLRLLGADVGDPEAGVLEPGLKLSPTSKKRGVDVYTYAFAKTDPFMKDLLEGTDENLRLLAEARVAVKSTTNESRTARMIGMAERGPLLVQLKYWGAHTGRHSGDGKMNFQNFERVGKDPRSGAVRKAIYALGAR